MQIVIVMNKLLEKVLNCYNIFLTNLSVGKTEINYDLLYDAILLLKNNITDQQYIEYFYNNLICNSGIVLEEVATADRLISYTLNASGTILPSFVWTDTYTPSLGSYSITTSPTAGYNFLYISAPSDVDIVIYDALNTVVFNSLIAGLYEFEVVGTVTTSNNQINTVYRKKNVYNSINPVTFRINIS